MNHPSVNPPKPEPPLTQGPFKRTKLNTSRPGRRRTVRHEISAGGVVVRQEKGKWLVVMLKTEHKRGEVWVLPKGHVEPHAGETVADAARREVEEEAGISDLSVKGQLGVTRFAFQAENALVKKKVHYFLMTTQQVRLTPQAEEGLIDAAWEPIDRAIELLAYDTDQEVVSKAREKLTGTPSRKRRLRPSSSKKGARIHT